MKSQAIKNTLKAEKISFLSSSSCRCGIVGKLNTQTMTGAVHNSSDCWQVCQSKRLSTCQGYVVKVKDFVHITRSNSLATNFEGSSGDTQTQSKTARRLCLCVRLRTQPQLLGLILPLTTASHCHIIVECLIIKGFQVNKNIQNFQFFLRDCVT